MVGEYKLDKREKSKAPFLWLVSVVAAGSLHAQTRQPEEGFAIVAGAQYSADSNFSRTAEASDEQIARALVGLGFNRTVSAQQFAFKVSTSQYRYAERDYLDESAWDGSASWRSHFSHSLGSAFSIERTEAPVDQLEFTGLDLVAKEDANARLLFGESQRLGLVVGAHQLRQSHSNSDRQYLDFEDQDLFAELRYRAPGTSQLSLRYRTGERNYEFPALLAQDLNFDYHQWEIETGWKLTARSELTGVAGYFEREGATNDDEGALAGLTWTWQTTAKLATEIAYSLNQPALGESTDSPLEINNSSITFRWKLSTKLQWSASGSYTEFEYDNPGSESPRIERNIAVTPVALEWELSDSVRLRLVGQWVERRSPIVARDYEGHLITGGLALVF